MEDPGLLDKSGRLLRQKDRGEPIYIYIYIHVYIYIYIHIYLLCLYYHMS